jgi:hypothetical protein
VSRLAECWESESCSFPPDDLKSVLRVRLPASIVLVSVLFETLLPTLHSTVSIYGGYVANSNLTPVLRCDSAGLFLWYNIHPRRYFSVWFSPRMTIHLCQRHMLNYVL